MRKRSSVALPALALVLLTAVAADALWRSVRPTPAVPPAAKPDSAAGAAAVAPDGAPARPSAPPRDHVVGHSAAAVPPVPPGPADVAARAATRRRIQLEGAGTYLADMLQRTDSVLHRWPAAGARRVLHVAVARTGVRGFRAVFGGNVAWAVSRWNGIGLPVTLETGGDTAGADIVVTWEERLDSNRTGRADVTWMADGAIIHVLVVLATHAPDGRPLVPSQMVALALHELGHAIGLGHSPVRSDAMYPETAAVELTMRDRRTAALLYQLPPGSLK